MTKKLPHYRFQGYTDAWELRKLGEVSKKISEKNVDNLYSETFTNSAEHGIISQRDFFDKDISNATNLNTYYIVQNNDFVYNPRISNYAPVGPVKRNKLGRTGVMSPLYYVFRTHDIDEGYLETYFDTTYWHSFMKLNGDSGARADRFAIKDSVFAEMPLPIPSLPEQEAIGTFFSTLDQHIALHQRKLDTLKEQKKTYLKLLFPVKGQTKPALHFQGFEDDWEEVKLGEVVSISSGYTGDATLNNGKYKLTRIETISEGKVDVSRTGFSNELPDEKYRLNFGDILFSNINSLVHIGKVAIFNTMEEVFHGINLLRLVPNKDLINPYFIYYQLVTESKKNWSKAHANQAVNQASINQTSLSTQKISISSLPEQKAIGTFFQTLDQEIAQVEDKLASLKEMKKTLLRKLFA
ncbi:restriction endonuclease subunit S [Streptococcus suis]|uniref:restriction endonuclease subunit S n=1 Tax=Streptococcus suis TaxID=1307 RepID=UPI003F8CC9CC